MMYVCKRTYAYIFNTMYDILDYLCNYILIKLYKHIPTFIPTIRAQPTGKGQLIKVLWSFWIFLFVCFDSKFTCLLLKERNIFRKKEIKNITDFCYIFISFPLAHSPESPLSRVNLLVIDFYNFLLFFAQLLL